MKYIIVIDMQNDFTYGALRNEQAIAVIPAIAAKLDAAFNADEPVTVLFTRDTHHDNYMSTQEGRRLPVPHCIEGSDGWQVVPELESFRTTYNCRTFDKPTFGSLDLAKALVSSGEFGPDDVIELVGVCTDICVISNAMLIKAALPEVTVRVDSACCAGVTPASHTTALEAMKACQIEVY